MENSYTVTAFLGFFISAASIYYFREKFITNFGWYFFKLQANYQILTKSKKKESTFELLYNGENIDLSKKNDDTIYDLLIYSRLSNDKVNYFTYSYNDFREFEKQNSLDYSFMSCVLNYNDEEYVIKLKTPDYSFYFENNIILSKSFILWYMKKFNNIKNINEYTITIIDHNIREVVLDSKINSNGILLCSDSYKILDKMLNV